MSLARSRKCSIVRLELRKATSHISPQGTQEAQGREGIRLELIKVIRRQSRSQMNSLWKAIDEL